MNNGRKNKLAGQIGEFLVCAELGKRGYIATSFTGNVPEFDLIVANDNLQTVPIQVKSSRGHSWPTKANLWIDIEIDDKNKKQIDHGNAIIKNPELIYVCVVIGAPEGNERDRYFILRKKELQMICSKRYRHWMESKNWKRPKNYKSLANRYDINDLRQHENKWSLIDEEMNKQKENHNYTTDCDK